MSTHALALWDAFRLRAKGYTRAQYAVYLFRRILESLVVAAMGGYLALYAQAHGYIRHASLRWLVDLTGTHEIPRAGLVALAYVQLYWWPAVAAFLSYLFFGPKQRQPIQLRISGVMYRYAGVNVDRETGARGGCIFGSTGTGKTAVCITPRNHSIAINECGIEKRSWRNSKARIQFEALKHTFRDQTVDIRRRLAELLREREELSVTIDPVQDRVIDELFSVIDTYQRANPSHPFTAKVFGTEDPDAIPPEVRFADKSAATPDDAIRLLTWLRSANRFGLLESLPDIGSTDLKKNITEYANLIEKDNALRSESENLLYLLQVKRNDLQKFADGIKALRYKVPPFGTLGIGAKGNEWQAAVPMLSYYDRDEDICLLQTRPDNAPPHWTPPAQFNLISYDSLPSTTYAQILFGTYMSISRRKDMDYFDNAGRDQIGFGIDLLRAIRDAQADKGILPTNRVIPNLALLCEIFTTLDQYSEFMVAVGAATKKKEVPYWEDEKQTDGTWKKVQKTKQIVPLPSLRSAKIDAARKQIEGGYWALADETLKSVMGAIRNVLVPFTHPDFQEVYCSINTFDLREMEFGKCVYIAMAPKFSVQRQYVNTILKNLTMTIINDRFALEESDPRWKNRNLLLIDSDEHQISAGKEDVRVDIIRAAHGTLYAASQMRNSLWIAYGSKEEATPIINNLRHLWATQGAHKHCAEETAATIGTIFVKEHSYSSNGGGTNTRYTERNIVTPGQIMALPPFHVYWVPAEGPYVFRFVIAMPTTPDGQIPHWWFGNWNILQWLARACFLPPSIHICGLRLQLHPGDRFYFPWRAKAPLRAQLRYIFGLDGTFIILRSVSRREAQRLSKPETER